MIKYCRVCKKQFSIPLSKERGYKNRQANKNFFCSRDCYKIYWKENIGQKGNKHWNWSGGNIKRKCDFCGKEFEKDDSTISDITPNIFFFEKIFNFR